MQRNTVQPRARAPGDLTRSAQGFSRIKRLCELAHSFRAGEELDFKPSYQATQTPQIATGALLFVEFHKATFREIRPYSRKGDAGAMGVGEPPNRPASGPRDQSSLTDQAMRGRRPQISRSGGRSKAILWLIPPLPPPRFSARNRRYGTKSRAREAAIFPFASTSG